MNSSLMNVVCNAYEVMLTRLRRVRNQKRDESRAGEFWADARSRVSGAVLLKSQLHSQTHWFGTEALPMEIEFAELHYATRYAAPRNTDVIAFERSDLSQAIEVA